MLSKLTRVCAAIALVSLLSGFGAGSPICNVVGKPFPQGPATTLENLEKPIGVQAAAL